jgi:hypothetical protein
MSQQWAVHAPSAAAGRDEAVDDVDDDVEDDEPLGDGGEVRS